MGIQCNQRGLGPRQIVLNLFAFVSRVDLLLNALQAILNGFDSRSLQRRIERRIHMQASIRHVLIAEVLRQFVAYEIHEVRRVGGIHLDWDELELRSLRRFHILFGDRSE